MADIKLNSSGGGSVTLTTPSTASNLTLTLPSASGTAATTAGTETLTNKTLTAAGGNTVEATSGPTSSQLAGNRNKIINGAMMIDQRNAGASVSITPTAYTLDRWMGAGTQASKFSVQQNAGSIASPVGFTNYLGVTSLSAYSVLSSDTFVIQQPIEGLNCSDLAWGTASAKTVTLSFQIYSSLTGTFGGALTNSAANRSYPFSYSIASANTWTPITVTIPGDTTGTWLTTNGIGILVRLGLGSGSTYSASAGAWTAGNIVQPTGSVSVVGTNGATFYITGVQLEKGATATPFENRLYGTELALCQRYFQYVIDARQNTNAAILASSFTASTIIAIHRFIVSMRASPTLSSTSALNFAVIGNGTAATTSAISLINAGTECARIDATASAMLQGGGCFIGANTGTSTPYISLSAEL